MTLLKQTKTKAPAKRLVTLEIGENTWPLTLRKRHGCRRITLRWHPVRREITVTLPPYVSYDEALRFTRSCEPWLLKHKPEPAQEESFAAGRRIRVMGQEWEIAHDPARRGVVAEEEGRLIVCGDSRFAERRLRDWLKAKAKREIERLVMEKSALAGYKVRAIRLRDTTSQWGSCTQDGTLSFSWRLVMAPPEVMEYVVCHEVAHIFEMGHNARFWAKVEQICPGYMQQEAWLKRHGHSLYNDC